MFLKSFKFCAIVIDFMLRRARNRQCYYYYYRAYPEKYLAILAVTSFYLNYNKTHKSRLKCEIKYALYKMHKKIKTKNLEFSGFRFF